MDKDKPYFHGHRQRLRQRFLQSGIDGFNDYELVELLLTLAIPRADVKKPAKDLIKRFNNLRGILDAPIEELQKVNGIGSVTPVALKIIRATATFYLQQSSEDMDNLNDHETLVAFWRMKIGALSNEVFEVVYLGPDLRFLRDGVERLEEGTVDRATVYPRKVVESALKRGATGLIFAHNQPNGHVQPSEKDKLLTRALVLAAETVSLKIVDHLIVSPDESFSFRKAGIL